MSTDTPSSDKTVATSLPVIGRSATRIDGPLKVSGVARYSSDFHFPGMLYAVPVGARIASGTIQSIDTAAAAAMPGVQKIYSRENIGTFYRVPKSSKAQIDERRPPLAVKISHFADVPPEVSHAHEVRENFLVQVWRKDVHGKSHGRESLDQIGRNDDVSDAQ